MIFAQVQKSKDDAKLYGISSKMRHHRSFFQIIGSRPIFLKLKDQNNYQSGWSATETMIKDTAQIFVSLYNFQELIFSTFFPSQYFIDVVRNSFRKFVFRNCRLTVKNSNLSKLVYEPISSIDDFSPPLFCRVCNLQS